HIWSCEPVRFSCAGHCPFTPSHTSCDHHRLNVTQRRPPAFQLFPSTTLFRSRYTRLARSRRVAGRRAGRTGPRSRQRDDASPEFPHRPCRSYSRRTHEAGGAMSDNQEIHERIPEALVRRLERLEQKYRRLQGTNRLLVVGVAVLLGTAAATVVTLALRLPRLSGDVVQARSFALRDANGRVRGVFGMATDGASQLVLQDER